MNIAVEIAGWAGALMVLGAYGLLMTGRVTSTSAVHRWLNALGSAGLIVNSVWNGAFPGAFLNVVWLSVTLYALARSRTAA